MTALPAHVRFPTDRLPDRVCPACGADGLRAFYAMRGVPVQSDVLVSTAEDAAAFPTGDVELALCETCAFITNTAFDASKRMATQAQEATRVDVPSCNGFARALAERWTTQYDLRGKTIVEIGCGQGEFLEMLCQRAGARGVGFDPAVCRDRSEIADVLFVAGLFEDFAAEVKADFILCRHALERITEPLHFLSEVRKPLVATPVAVEVADTQRILTDGAFWDIHYEHNGYFTRESLTRVFQRAGFDVGRTSVESDVYSIVLEAEPTGGQKRDMPTLTELRLASQFVRVCTTRMLEWIAFAEDARRRGRRCVIWGAGSKAVGFLTTLGIVDAFLAVIDFNPTLLGSYLPGTRLRIEQPPALRELRPEAVVVMNSANRDKIFDTLSKTCLSPTLLTL